MYFKPNGHRDDSPIIGDLWELALEPPGLRFKCCFRLHREADCNIARTIEHFDDVIAKQTTELAARAAARGQLNAAITGIAVGTCDVGFLHALNMRSGEPLSSGRRTQNI